MFVPTQFALSIYLGSTFRRGFALTTLVNGVSTALDVTGWTARMQIREKLSSEFPLVSMTTENGGLLFEVTKNNQVVTSSILYMYLSPLQTDAISVRRGVYDLEVVDVVGDVYRIFEGSVTFHPQVTR